MPRARSSSVASGAQIAQRRTWASPPASPTTSTPDVGAKATEVSGRAVSVCTGRVEAARHVAHVDRPVVAGPDRKRFVVREHRRLARNRGELAAVRRVEGGGVCAERDQHAAAVGGEPPSGDDLALRVSRATCVPLRASQAAVAVRRR